MSQLRYNSLAWIAIALIIAMLAGCAGMGQSAPDWRQKAVFGTAGDLPQVVVYGNLARFVPRFNPTPKLDEFLYGPTEPPGLLLRNPQGLAMLGATLLVCDQGYPDIIGIDLATGRSTNWENRDHPPRCPVAIIVGEDGHVYVADTTIRAVLVYDAKGCLVEQLTPDARPERTFRPCSLAMRQGVLYVGNLGHHRVDRYDGTRREWIAPIPADAGTSPVISPTGLAFAPDGTLLIVDSMQARVLRVGADGKWLKPIGARGRLPGQFVRPKQVACTRSGLILVTDAGRQSVVVFDSKGEFVTEVLEQKEWPGFTLPAGALALPAEALSMLSPEPGPGPEPRPDEWVIVSDTLQASSLSLLGIILPHAGGTTHAAP